MEKETIRWVIGRFLKKLLKVNLIIFVGSALLNLALGWRTWWDYGSTLMWAGVIIIIFFGVGGFGANSLRSNDMTGFALTGAKDIDKQLKYQQDLESNRIIQSIQYLLIAAVPMIVGTVLQSL